MVEGLCVCANVCMIQSTNGSLRSVKDRNVSVDVSIKNQVKTENSFGVAEAHFNTFVSS